ncbi:helix-turn-helix transcriptional regulator [Cryptosporangium sp. NPDC048952]|uniref:helix-turn-helix transcriptional regulator n=1 Tax=Cryptosporangium sp. NPDC048952 TaxID=3363961 RepID=UPI003717944D
MPVNVVELSTADPERAHQAINDIYAPSRPVRVSGRPENFAFSLRSSTAGEMGGEVLRHSMAARSLSGPLGMFAACTVAGGRISFCSGGEEATLGRGGVARYPTEADLLCSWEDIRLTIVRVPWGALEGAAGSRSGGWRFTGLAPVSDSAAAQWRTVTDYAHRTLHPAGLAGDNPLICAALVDLVATTALSVFPNTLEDVGHVTAGGRGALRRAVSYIEAHAPEPIGLADIVGASGASGPALRAAFRSHYSTTPTGYLRRVRVEGVHRDLRASDPGRTTVDEVAARWGFRNSARFAAYYHRQYGAPPSHTLETEGR